jgi:hypothetical protein
VVRGALAVIAALAISLTGLANPPAAHAADDPTMEFSADGVNWSTVYSGQLFAGVLVIPGGSATRTFWVRNDAPEPGILRLTLAKVSTNSTALADATTIAATASTVAPSVPSSVPGVAVPLSAAQPCYTLSEGLIVDAGGAVDITNTMALADVDGLAAQAGWVSFVLRITFSSTDQGAAVPNTCPTEPDTGTVAGSTEPTVVDSSPTATTASTTVYRRVASGWQATTPAVQTPTPVASDPGVASLPVPFRQLVANTYRFYQEWTVAFWMLMLLIGASVLLLIRYRRHRREDEEYYALLDLASYPTYPNPNSQMGPTR